MKIVKSCMLLLITVLLLTFVLPAFSPTQITYAASPYEDYGSLMAAFMSLAQEYPQLVTYQTVGETVLGKEIIMFKIGNPDGGRVLFDGAIHGTEAIGSELLYSYAAWLLESNDTLAKNIIRTTYTLLIPLVNGDGVDNYTRKNAEGVDLNRNFPFGWWNDGSANSSNDEYRGPASLSEPESQALDSVFTNYKPSFYVNLHMWDGPYWAGCRYVANTTYYSMLVNETRALSKERGVTPFPYYGEFAGYGMAIGDAAHDGITSFLIELTSDIIPLSEVQTILLAEFIPVASVLSQEAKPQASQPTHPWDINQDGIVNLADLAILAAAYNSTSGSLNWNPAADINADGIVNIEDLILLSLHYRERYS